MTVIGNKRANKLASFASFAGVTTMGGLISWMLLKKQVKQRIQGQQGIWVCVLTAGTRSEMRYILRWMPCWGNDKFDKSQSLTVYGKIYSFWYWSACRIVLHQCWWSVEYLTTLSIWNQIVNICYLLLNNNNKLLSIKSIILAESLFFSHLISLLSVWSLFIIIEVIKYLSIWLLQYLIIITALETNP